MSRGSPHILNGFGQIVNFENIEPGTTAEDLRKLEASMFGGPTTTQSRDPNDMFDRELADAARSLGIEYDAKKPPRVDVVEISARPMTAFEEEAEEEEEEAEEEDEADEAENLADEPAEERPRFTGTSQFGLARPTQEQTRRAAIDNVMGSSVIPSNFSFEHEKREDLKCAMLSEIDILMESMREEDVDLSRIQEVGSSTDFAVVESVLKMLRHKNDHMRYCGFAEEFLIFGAGMMEELFDGKRTFAGRYTPDLTGWSTQVNTKLKRMRVETSQIVSEFMHDYNVSPFVRVLIELVPNMFMYSRMRSRQHGQTNLYAEIGNDDTADQMGLL